MAVNVTGKIPMPLYDRLKQLCEDKGYTVSEAVRRFIEQGLQQVDREGKPIKPEGYTDNTVKKEGKAMEDKELLQVLKELEGLKLARVEDKHNIERSLDEFSRTLQELRGDIASLRDAQEAKESELRTIRQGLLELSEKVVDKSSLAKSLEELCRSDPDNPLCRIAREEGRKAAKDIVEEAKSKAKIELDHESWEEVWNCPTCRPGLIRQALTYAWEDIFEEAKKKGLFEEKKEDEEREEKKAFF